MKTTVAALAVVLVCGVSFGQETKEMPKEVREHLQKLQGRWQLSGNAGDAKYTVEYTVTWSPVKNCVFATWSGIMANKPVKGSAAIGWDALEAGCGGIPVYERRSLHCPLESQIPWSSGG